MARILRPPLTLNDFLVKDGVAFQVANLAVGLNHVRPATLGDGLPESVRNLRARSIPSLVGKDLLIRK